MFNYERESIQSPRAQEPKIEYIPLEKDGQAVVFHDAPSVPDIRLIQKLGLKPEIGKMFDEAGDVFGLDFSGLNQQDIEVIDNYSLRKINLVLTLAKYMADKKNQSVQLFAGYGDNQFAAMIAAGAFKERKKAFELFQVIIEAKERVLENGERCVVQYPSFGKKPEQLKKSLEKLLEEKGVFVSARRSEQEVVLSGRGEDIGAIKLLLETNKIRVLNRQKIALNCSLLKDAKEPIKEQLNKTAVRDTVIPIVSNTGEIISAKEEIRREILKVTETILWDEVLVTVNDKAEKGIKGQIKKHPKATAATVIFLGAAAGFGVLVGGKKILDSRQDKKK